MGHALVVPAVVNPDQHWPTGMQYPDKDAYYYVYGGNWWSDRSPVQFLV